MDELNQGSGADLTNKRKRDQPRRDESQNQQQVNPPPNTTTDGNLIGQVVSGVVEGSFEAGYFLNVKVADTENLLKGIVFLPGKVCPVTPTTDLFPQAKMHAREDIPIPSLNKQTPPPGKKDAGNQTDDFGSEPQTDALLADKNQFATSITSPPHGHPTSDAGVSSVAIRETYLPIDTQMKDLGSSAKEKLTEPKGQTLSLMPQFAGDDVPKEDHDVVRYEACGTKLKTLQRQATGPISALSLELFQNETKRSKIEDVKSPTDAGTCELEHTVEEKLASPVDDVPKELQLELGNKSMSASSVATEAKAEQSVSSKSGFLTNLCEGREETAKEPEEPITNVASESGFPEATTHEAD